MNYITKYLQVNLTEETLQIVQSKKKPEPKSQRFINDTNRWLSLSLLASSLSSLSIYSRSTALTFVGSHYLRRVFASVLALEE